MDQKELCKQENDCVQEYALVCTATYPVNVDVRGMVVEIVKGDYTTASKLYRKAILFPISSTLPDGLPSKRCCRVLTPQMTQRYHTSRCPTAPSLQKFEFSSAPNE